MNMFFMFFNWVAYNPRKFRGDCKSLWVRRDLFQVLALKEWNQVTSWLGLNMGVVIMGHSFHRSISTWSGKLLQFNLQIVCSCSNSGKWTVKVNCVFFPQGCWRYLFTCMIRLKTVRQVEICASSKHGGKASHFQSLDFQDCFRWIGPLVAGLTSRFPSSETWTIWLSILPKGFPVYLCHGMPFVENTYVYHQDHFPLQLWCWTPYALRVRCLPSWRERKRKKEMNDAMNISSWRFVDSVNPHVTTPWGGMDCTGQPIWL